MNADLEERYFKWLYSKVVLEQAPSPSRKFYKLFRLLHTTEFVWLVSGDDNRAEYGKELRRYFLIESRTSYSGPDWLMEPCSVLEMLIALAEATEFETEIPKADWFWVFMDHLGLADMNDQADVDWGEAREIVDEFVWRTYRPNGNGGLFPLRHPKEDQRGVELWYQFSAYAIEKELV